MLRVVFANISPKCLQGLVLSSGVQGRVARPVLLADSFGMLDATWGRATASCPVLSAWCHVFTKSGVMELIGSYILQEAKIAPSRLHVPDSNSFFSLGARKTGASEWDAKELSRIIHSTWFLSKQQCSLVFLGIAWGEATSVKEGGEYNCCQLTCDSGTVHHQRAKMWVTNSNSHIKHEQR